MFYLYNIKNKFNFTELALDTIEFTGKEKEKVLRIYFLKK